MIQKMEQQILVVFFMLFQNMYISLGWLWRILCLFQLKFFQFGLNCLYFHKKMHDCANFSRFNFAMESDLKNGTTDLESAIVGLSDALNMKAVNLAVRVPN